MTATPTAMTARPQATATIEECPADAGESSASSDDAPATVAHQVTLVVKFSRLEERFSDKERVTDLVQRALAVFADNAPRLADVMGSSPATRTQRPVAVVAGIEGVLAWPGQPDDAAVQQLRALLEAAGYRVNVLLRRGCREPRCVVNALLDWRRAGEVPSGWYSANLCGAHNYRTCVKCSSVYRLTAENAAGQAAALNCEVCGKVLVEWGSSKVWSAELIERSETISPGPEIAPHRRHDRF